MLTEIFRKLESSLSFSYEIHVTEGKNQRRVKAIRHDERFCLLSQIDKLYQELK